MEHHPYNRMKLESEYKERNGHPINLQWHAVFGASMIASIVLMIVPRARPWSGLTFFAPVVMGRVLPDNLMMPITVSKILHLLLAFGYGFMISVVVTRITQLYAVITGAILGLVLYFINFTVVSMALPQLIGDEPVVAFTHMFFGGIVGGAYRGLLKRRVQQAD